MELRGASVAVTGAIGFLGRYLVDVHRRWQDHEDANVRGTENVFGTVAAAGVKRVVHVSSVVVYRQHRPLIDRLMLPIPMPAVRIYDNRRARDDLGWRNRPFVEALRETFAREAQGTAAR
jgi:nucleoside-diphosphate-sugar epimerase